MGRVDRSGKEELAMEREGFSFLFFLSFSLSLFLFFFFFFPEHIGEMARRVLQ